MKIFFTFLLLVATGLQAQQQIKSISLTGYVEGARTVHFSDDGKYIYGDWDHLVKWDLKTMAILTTTPIPGYNTNKTAFNGSDMWVNGNSNYNSSKKDVADMHRNLNVWDGTNMQKGKVVNSYGHAVFVPGSKDVIIVSANQKYQYSVVRFNTLTREESTLYFSEKTDGTGVPTAMKVSPDSSLLAVSFAGDVSGVSIYDLSSGKKLHTISSKKDANDLAFSGDGRFLFFNDGPDLVRSSINGESENKRWVIGTTITSIDANIDGALVALALQRKGAVVFNTVKNISSEQLCRSNVFDVTFSPDYKYLGLGIRKTLKSDKAASIFLFDCSQF